MLLIRAYIWRSILATTAAVLGVVIAVQVLLELIHQLNSIGQHQYGLLQAFIFVIFHLPGDMYRLFPMVGFLGALLAMGRLASSSELTVIRAAGISKTAIVRMVVSVAVLMMVVVTLVGEVAAPWLESRASALRDRSLDHVVGLVGSSTWLHDKNRFIYIADVAATDNLKDITVFRFDKKQNLLSQSHASGARLIEGQWLLQDVNTTNILAHKTVLTSQKTLPLHSHFDPVYQYKAKNSSSGKSLLALYKNIMYLHRMGLSSGGYQFSFWQRILQPLTTIIMIALGVPFVFGSMRNTAASSRIVLGILMGFGFYMLNQFFGPLTLLYQFPPFLAAASPALLFLAIYLILMRRT